MQNAARQINILCRFSGISDIKEREVIHKTFILVNVNYCPLVCHFCDKSFTMKIENTQERALRFLLNDKTSSFALLLEKSNSTTLHVRRMKVIACEDFKSLNDLNPSFMKEMFQNKQRCSVLFKRFTYFISITLK